MPAVVLVIGTLEGGGAERQLSDMANYFAEQHWQVTLASWSGPERPDFYHLDPRVRRSFLLDERPHSALPSRVFGLIKATLNLRKLLSLERADAVLSFVTQSNVLAILAATGLRTRVIVSERTQPSQDESLSQLWRQLRRFLYPRADEVVAQTRDAADWLQDNCHSSVTVIPNALRSLPRASCTRRTLIIAVGRLGPEKGFDVLLKAFAKIAPELPEWNLAIIGEGHLRFELTRLRDQLLLADRVEFMGHLRDVAHWMASAGLVVQPSRFEGFPNVVLEAMGMGAAVISSDCSSGPSDMIRDGVNGRLVPVDDVEALASAMRDLMLKPEERDRLGKAAMYVREKYRQDLIMARWEKCLLGGNNIEDE